ncbi:hypothetical protein [uncultured Litoreibacter sp.]|uniref:hypothetical protein n=1 Tax=uncultured Litoreibacter sp. TaxID=1392394 RepID=UPI002628BF80|nr:hypothetical protein [uncultured Litoreibacter sp.]
MAISPHFTPKKETVRFDLLTNNSGLASSSRPRLDLRGPEMSILYGRFLERADDVTWFDTVCFGLVQIFDPAHNPRNRDDAKDANHATHGHNLNGYRAGIIADELFKKRI